MPHISHNKIFVVENCVDEAKNGCNSSRSGNWISTSRKWRESANATFGRREAFRTDHDVSYGFNSQSIRRVRTPDYGCCPRAVSPPHYRPSPPIRSKSRSSCPAPISDNDWNAGGYNGLMAVKETLGLDVAYSENVGDADVERVMRDYASRGYGLVIAHSFSYGSATLATRCRLSGRHVSSPGTVQELAPNVGTYDNPDYQGRLSDRHAVRRRKQVRHHRLGRRYARAQHCWPTTMPGSSAPKR